MSWHKFMEIRYSDLNTEQKREYNRKINIEYRNRNREKYREATRRGLKKYYQKNKNNEKYKNKIKARQIINRAIINNKIDRKDCIICEEKRAEAHHEDYSKPFNVMWLCKLHHTKLHINLLKEKK